EVCRELAERVRIAARRDANAYPRVSRPRRSGEGVAGQRTSAPGRPWNVPAALEDPLRSRKGPMEEAQRQPGGISRGGEKPRGGAAPCGSGSHVSRRNIGQRLLLQLDREQQAHPRWPERAPC